MNVDCETSDQRELRRSFAPLSVVAHESQIRLHQAAARFRSAITLQVPVGYEDEQGFHYGAPRRLVTVATPDQF